jgi:hypothetical protein
LIDHNHHHHKLVTKRNDNNKNSNFIIKFNNNKFENNKQIKIITNIKNKPYSTGFQNNSNKHHCAGFESFSSSSDSLFNFKKYSKIKSMPLISNISSSNSSSSKSNNNNNNATNYFNHSFDSTTFKHDNYYFPSDKIKKTKIIKNLNLYFLKETNDSDHNENKLSEYQIIEASKYS